MTTATETVWEAKVKWVRRGYTKPAKKPRLATPVMPAGADGELPEEKTQDEVGTVCDCFVDVFPPGDERIRFRVNRREGRDLTFTDPRERTAGTAGTTGLWGTLPPLRAVKPRPLTRIEFRAELARLVGAEKAEEIVNDLVKKFRPFYDSCQTMNVEAGG
jgi:hypothetical protein